MKPSIIKIRHRCTSIDTNVWEIVEKKWYGYKTVYKFYCSDFDSVKKVFDDMLSLPFYKSEEELYKK